MFIIESVTVEVLGRLGKAGRGLSAVVGVFGGLGKAGRGSSVVVGVFGGLGKAGRGSSAAVIEDKTVAFMSFRVMVKFRQCLSLATSSCGHELETST